MFVHVHKGLFLSVQQEKIIYKALFANKRNRLVMHVKMLSLNYMFQPECLTDQVGTEPPGKKTICVVAKS